MLLSELISDLSVILNDKGDHKVTVNIDYVDE